MTKKGADDTPISVNQTMTDSPGSFQAARDLVINTGETSETKEKLREIAETLKGLGEQHSKEKLLKQYPLGYVIFEIDHKNLVFPYDQQLLDEYDIDWSVVKLNPAPAGRFDLRLPDFRRKAGGEIVHLQLAGKKEASKYAAGATLGGLAMLCQILDVREDGMIFLVGFAPFVGPNSSNTVKQPPSL